MTRELLNRFADLQRHWCPLSEMYTGCDSLLNMLEEGWLPGPVVLIEERWFKERHQEIYHFQLYRQDHITHMRILGTPYLYTVMQYYELQTAPFHVAEPVMPLQESADDPLAVRKSAPPRYTPWKKPARYPAIQNKAMTEHAFKSHKSVAARKR